MQYPSLEAVCQLGKMEGLVETVEIQRGIEKMFENQETTATDGNRKFYFAIKAWIQRKLFMCYI